MENSLSPLKALEELVGRMQRQIDELQKQLGQSGIDALGHFYPLMSKEEYDRRKNTRIWMLAIKDN